MPQSKAHIAATTRYEKKAYDRIPLRLRKDSECTAEDVRLHAESRGESVNAFITRAIIETMVRDNSK